MTNASNIARFQSQAMPRPITIDQPAAPVTGAYKVDVTKGKRIGTVSSQWFSRPDDEKYLCLDDLYAATRARADACRVYSAESARVVVNAATDRPDGLTLAVDGRADASMTHWAFGQMSSLVGAPAAYLRSLPAPIAGINLQYGLMHNRSELVKVLEHDDGTAELRAITGPEYGRIYDHELVAAVQKIAGNGRGDTRWKVPGMLDWSTMEHNPYVDVTKDTTTLYASDRDVFLFLCDDAHPIEAGRNADGTPDLYFRGFYAWNSEVGSKTLGIATFYLRAVCQNRNLWGTEGFSELKIRHSKFAADRFAYEARPALERYGRSDPSTFVQGIAAAKAAIVATTEEERIDFMTKRAGFGRSEAAKIIETVTREEGRPPMSVFDFVQGITATARDKAHQDTRLDLEQRAATLMRKAA